MDDLVKLFSLSAPTFSVKGADTGVLEPGNIDLTNRPVVRNPDGTMSTVLSMSINEDGKEVLIPMVAPSGTLLSPEGAIAIYHLSGKHLGKFKDPATADAYAQALHEQQAQFYRGR